MFLPVCKHKQTQTLLVQACRMPECCTQDVVSKHSKVVRAPSSTSEGPKGSHWEGLQIKMFPRAKKEDSETLILWAHVLQKKIKRGREEKEQKDKAWIKVWNINTSDVRLLFPMSWRNIFCGNSVSSLHTIGHSFEWNSPSSGSVI